MDPLVDQAPMVQPATEEQGDQGGQNKAEISSLLLTCNMYVSVLECHALWVLHCMFMQ